MGRRIVAIASFEGKKITLLKVTFDDSVVILTRIRNLQLSKKKKNSYDAGSSSRVPDLE